MRGPKPKPLELKILEGNRGHRPLPDRIVLGEGPPDPPADLTESAKAEWLRVAGLLAARGLVQQMDLTMLRIYVDAVEQYNAANKQLAAEGPLVEGRYGPMLNPLFRVAEDAKSTMMRIMEQFGGSPVSRTRLAGVGNVKAKNDKSKYFA